MAKPEENLNKELMEYENLEKQLEVILIQKHQLQIQQNDVKHALEELKKAGGDVYRSIGSVMIQSSKEDAEKDLTEKSELIQVKLGAIEKQEEKLRSIVMDTQKKLQERMRGHGKQ